MKKNPKRKFNELSALVLITVIAFFTLVGTAMIAANVANTKSKSSKLASPTLFVKMKEGLCSGVHIGNGIVITAAHCNMKIQTVKTDKGEVFPVEVLWSAPPYDVALLQMQGDGNKFPQSAELSCRVPPIGEEITVEGNPLGFEFTKVSGKVMSSLYVEGMMKSKLKKLMPGEDDDVVLKQMILVNVTVVPGNSGGPVYDKQGRVVGIANAFAYVPTVAMIVPGKTLCTLLGRS